jgi:hypothetical protein
VVNRFEREELAELILRTVQMARDEQTALLAVPPDMGKWVETAEASKNATRELWEALYRIEIQEADDSPKKGVSLPARQHRFPQQRG